MPQQSDRPRRQAEPPNEEGIWVRIAYGQRRAFHFTQALFGDGTPRGSLECGVPGMWHGPRTMHEHGYEWEGPFPVPSLEPANGAP